MQDEGACSSDSIPRVDGGWMRRERERIAIGRRRVADRLGVPESRLVIVELRRRPVPAEWLPVLKDLGFPPLPDAQPDAPPDERSDALAGSVALAAPAPPPIAADPRPSSEATAGIVAPPSEVAMAVETLPSSARMEEEHQQPATLEDPLAPLAAPSGAPPAPVRRVDGEWLTIGRLRLGLSVSALSRQLGVSWTTYARIEQQSLLVPSRWWPTLQKLGFDPPELPQVAPASAEPPRLRGRWLQRERTRLGITQADLRSELKAFWQFLDRVERHNLPVPDTWIPALRRLQMNVDVPPLFSPVPGAAAKQPSPAPPRRAKAGRAKKRAAPARPTAEPAAQTPPAAPLRVPVSTSSPASTGGDTNAPRQLPSKSVANAAELAALAELIVRYRLGFGQRVGQSPSEILSGLALDLRESGAEQAISLDDVEQVVQLLVQRDRSAE